VVKDLYKIKINYTNENINRIIQNHPERKTNFTRHFNHNEEYFIRFDSNFHVPQFKIHHDINNIEPAEEYIDKITDLIRNLTFKLPDLFENTIYFFDPLDILKLCFFEIYKYENTDYLFLLKIDLSYKPYVHTLINRGTNDITASYSSNILFLDPVFIPVKEIVKQNNKLNSFIIKSYLSETWIDEKGDFYHKTGYWMDNALTKFFSKLFFRSNRKYYPYYPLICRYNTICQFLYNFSKMTRTESLPFLHNAYQFLMPHLSLIQQTIRKKIEYNMEDFDKVEELGMFKELKNNVPDNFLLFSDSIKIDIYLSKNDMKEYKIVI
jgi:hypothetical protein